jgi:TonB family protein
LDLRKSEDDKKRWGSIAASYAVQIVATIALLVYSVLAPKLDPAPFRRIELVAPDLETAPAKVAQAKPVRQPVKPQPAQIALSAPPRIIAPPVVIEPRQPQRLRRPVPVEEVAQPQLTVATKFDPKLLNEPKAPAKIVATNTFSGSTATPVKTTAKIVATNTFTGSSATPTLGNVAPSKVQTGGFGDPNGVPVNAHGSGKANIAAVGSFDLPSGAGNGNGTGGASGARGTIASAGFGNGVAVQGRPGTPGQAHIQSTGFVAQVAAPAEHHAKVVSDVSVPVSIQSKPTPVYTAEARQARVEGEVLLNVVFTATGQIRILNVVRGLGHGLDEAAQRAAQGVKFTPAIHNGHPVDSNATLRIVFQIS